MPWFINKQLLNPGPIKRKLKNINDQTLLSALQVLLLSNHRVITQNIAVESKQPQNRRQTEYTVQLMTRHNSPFDLMIIVFDCGIHHIQKHPNQFSAKFSLSLYARNNSACSLRWTWRNLPNKIITSGFIQ